MCYSKKDLKDLLESTGQVGWHSGTLVEAIFATFGGSGVNSYLLGIAENNRRGEGCAQNQNPLELSTVCSIGDRGAFSLLVFVGKSREEAEHME